MANGSVRPKSIRNLRCINYAAFTPGLSLDGRRPKTAARKHRPTPTTTTTDNITETTTTNNITETTATNNITETTATNNITETTATNNITETTTTNNAIKTTNTNTDTNCINTNANTTNNNTNNKNTNTYTDKSSPINLSDTKTLFASVSTPKLIKASATLHVSAIEPMVDFGMWVMRSRLMEDEVVRELVLRVTEHTFYDHFCAGKDLETAGRTMRRLWDAGLRAMLDYGLEHANDNESCDRNADEVMRTVDMTKSLDNSPVSFVVVKITAICPPALLKRVSDLLRWEFKDKSLHLPWKLNSFPLFADSSPLYHTPKKPEPLTEEEKRDLHAAYERLVKICDNSLEARVPLLIDAEDTAIQPAIDYFAYSAAMEYNLDGRPLIFNTIQAYLKDAKARLVIAKRAADEMGVPVGFKLVRGAYMSSENRLASSLGVKSPIHDSLQDTHTCYNECADFMIEQIAKGSGSVVLATHNVESGKFAAAKAINLGIKKDNRNLQFAQLYGMAESLSFSLRNVGFNVSKYLPFGPVDQIMPYLLRRAEENRGLLSASSLDRHLMRSELVRRLTSPAS